MKLTLVLCAVAVGYAATFNHQDDLAQSKARGKEVYENNCIVCHMGQGEGVPDLNPPLAKSDYLLKNPEKALRAIKLGMEGPVVVNGKKYNGMMAPLGLSNEEVSDVMNYISNSWGNKSTKVYTPKMVESIK
jgi:mono/diheme cytochrome c family protein